MAIENFDNTSVDVQSLKPFKKFIMSIGELPTNYIDSLSYAELLTWFCDYLQNKVIPVIDNHAEAIEELQNFFNNLDLQDEIDKKLDEMASDGTLETLVKPYFDKYIQPQINNQNNIINNQNLAIQNLDENINNFENNVNNEISIINNKVNSITSGSPKGVYSSLSALENADPNHEYIYITSDNGHWYYYNGSQWTDGGIYQSTGIDNNTITFDMLNSDLIKDINLRTKISNELNYNEVNIDLSNFSWVNKSVSDSTGEILPSVQSGALTNEKLIYIPPKSNISIQLLNDYTISYYSIFYYNENKEYIGRRTQFNIISPTDLNGSYIRIMFVKSGILATDITNMNLILNKLENNNIKYKNTNINLVNPSLVHKNKYINTTTHLLDNSTTYSTTDFIPLESGVYTTLCRMRFYELYTSEKNRIGSTIQNIEANSQITITNEKYIRFTYYNADSNIMFYKGSEIIPFEPFKKVLEETSALSDTMKNEINDILNNLNSSNVLWGKKLVTCGDSFTQYTNAQFDSGRFQGQNKVYPYLIALRNNMQVHNMAISGGTMATGDFTSANKFSAGLYQQIDADADYILLKYGINDNNNNVPIGAINDTTTDTFYGAWNTVMNYIINNHPLAKIGIIITNGLVYHTNEPNGSNYANAIIEIAKKYGIPTLNEWNDNSVPLLLRTGRTDVLESIRNKRLETFRVTPSNTHENYQCHEYESTIIEDFLRKL